LGTSDVTVNDRHVLLVVTVVAEGVHTKNAKLGREIGARSNPCSSRRARAARN
jgi:hypothetical protein